MSERGSVGEGLFDQQTLDQMSTNADMQGDQVKTKNVLFLPSFARLCEVLTTSTGLQRLKCFETLVWGWKVEFWSGPADKGLRFMLFGTFRTMRRKKWAMLRSRLTCRFVFSQTCLRERNKVKRKVAKSISGLE